MYVFVYGSLRRGFPNHFFLVKSIYMGEYHTVDKYHMVGQISRAYPYIVKPEHDLGSDPVHIIGELYDIDEDVLADLDNLEGYEQECDDFYTRRLIRITDGNNEKNAYVYILENKCIIEEIKNNMGYRFELVPSGDWTVA